MIGRTRIFKGVSYKLEIDTWNFGDGVTKNMARNIKSIIKNRHKGSTCRTLPARKEGMYYVYSKKE